MEQGEIYFEDVEVGDEIGPVARSISSGQVLQFLEMSGTRSNTSRFTDDDEARGEGLPSAIVPGAMNMAIVSQLLTSWTHGVSIKTLDLVFRKPVTHNSHLRLMGVVIGTEEVDGEPRVDCDVFIEDEEKTKLVMGTATVSLPSRC